MKLPPTIVNASEICRCFKDYLAASPRIGQVHSVFRTSINLQIEDQLFALLAPTRDLVPYGIRISDIHRVSFHPIRPKDPVFVGHHQISINGTFADCLIDCTEAVPVDLRLAACRQPISQQLFEQFRMYIAQALQTSDSAKEGIAPVIPQLFPKSAGFFLLPNNWSRFLAPLLTQFYHALRTGELAAVRLYAENIAGCGPGLTPSSDDMAEGILAVYHCFGASVIDPALTTAICQQIVAGMVPKTNQISASHLFYSGQGLSSPGILELMKAFVQNDPYEVIHTLINRVVDYGATSGTDLLTGIWLGFAALCQILPE